MPKHAGFSLMEILIVLAILAIIAGIAFPSYQESTRKTRRSEGHSLLLEAAQRQERHYTEFGRYATTMAATGTIDADTLVLGLSSPSGYYALGSSALSTTAFTLTATPQAGQANDPCGTLTLTHSGIKGRLGTGDRCW